ncbi:MULTISPECIES: ABC transporter permease subunit [unclassified Methylophilus]|jgi:ABC-2 type transport system permease protein|uniref:ABC transporter permease n=1 Tax=Methylophilus glucosoxydans TaxID=752553 RepID=A0ABW3GPD6_9PROT|nr:MULTISPECIES: ABC transporter permease subunit [unclassified Methylophilus]MBF5038654.1 ABC transporter permease subunit [Methylophilus sp. 13]MDF0378814.1 ABC transporter permease subunit [Methylophilus sp. YYY-1]MDT7848003.1 ABC transporter permease subunit [Methylophilus sp. VKM B-3414]BEV07418.1 ABC transporter permease subunit [Methylophilus sp. DW102]
MILIIARKELRSLFATPMGWLVLAIFQAIVGTYYSLSFNQYFEIMQSAHWQVQRIGLTQFMAEGVFGVAAVLMLFVVPLVSMKLISEERKNQTMALLMSAPLSMTELILGKLLGILSYLSLLILSMVLMIALLLPWAEIDLPYLLTHAFGLWLLMLASSALGLYISCLTANPILAAFCSLTALTFWLLLDKFFSDDHQALFHDFSLMQHYRQFALGILNSYDILFFVLFAGFFVLLAIRRLHADRLYG